MFRVKICGVTSPDDAALVAEAGAEAVGLNFYPRSPRCVDAAVARQIVAALPEGVVKVGLFVHAERDEICRRVDELELDVVQLHGDEPPQFLARLDARPVMRAFRVGAGGLSPMIEYLAECRRIDCMPRLVLADAQVKGLFGGSGQVADWESLGAYPADGSLPPLVLAGGLTAENVAAAIRAVHPAAVDAASGVESSPGRKDPALVRRFVAAALEAFAGSG